MEQLKSAAMALGPLVWIALYGVMTICQLAAFAAGIDVWLGWPFLGAVVVFVLLQMVPFGAIAAVVIAFIGARTGWGWAWWQALLLVAPFLVLGLVAQMAGGIGSLLLRRREAY